MSSLLVQTFFILQVIRLILTEFATPCEQAKCILPNCRCSSTNIPGGLHRNNTPQFVLFTFDDAVNVLNVEYYKKAFEGRTNPNKCPAAATFFVSHDYSNYQLVFYKFPYMLIKLSINKLPTIFKKKKIFRFSFINYINRDTKLLCIQFLIMYRPIIGDKFL